MVQSKWATRPIFSAAIAALYLASWQLFARAQTLDEPQFAFALRTLPGFTGSTTVEGGVFSGHLGSRRGLWV